MTARIRVLVTFSLCLLPLLLAAQQAKPGMLSAQDLKRALPASYFFAGQSAPVEARNSAGFRTADGKVVLTGLVDTSGYASDLTQKFQGLLITEAKLKIGDADLGPGAYGFGFTKDGKFVVMNVAAEEVLSTAANSDDAMAHPVPLKLTESGGEYRLYAGKKWVAMKSQ